MLASESPMDRFLRAIDDKGVILPHIHMRRYKRLHPTRNKFTPQGSPPPMVPALKVEVQIPSENQKEGDRETIREFKRFVTQLCNEIKCIAKDSKTSLLVQALRRNGFVQITLATKEHKAHSQVSEKKFESPFLVNWVR